MKTESALLEAVRDQIRSVLNIKDRQCEIEFDDDEIPAIVGDLYIIVMPGTIQPGPRHDSSGGVMDRIFSVDVSVVIRATAKPADRRREIFNANLGSINARLQAVFDAIDFSYVTMNAANVIIQANESSSEGFTEPLRFAGAGRIRPVPGETFKGGGNEKVAGLIRRMSYGGARRIKTRTNT